MNSPSSKQLSRGWEHQRAVSHTDLARLNIAFVFFPISSFSDSNGVLSANLLILVFLVDPHWGERGLEEFCSLVSNNWFGTMCWPQLPVGRRQRRVGKAHDSACSRPPQNCPPVQRSPKGSHSIQNKVNEFIPASFCPWIWNQDS